MSFRKENLTLEQSLDINVHKHINSLKTSRNLQLKVLEQEERTTVDHDIKYFAAS